MPVYLRTICYILIPSKTKGYVKTELIILDLKFFSMDDETSVDFEFYDDQVSIFILPKVKIPRKDCLTNLYFSGKKFKELSNH